MRADVRASTRVRLLFECGVIVVDEGGTREHRACGEVFGVLREERVRDAERSSEVFAFESDLRA